jgi:RHS repeat-associated protein
MGRAPSNPTVSVTVQDSSGTAQAGLPVYVFDGANYTGHEATTDGSGQVAFTLPSGSYRFRADLNATQFFSNASNDCSVPGCEADTLTVTIPVTVTVQDTSGAPAAGLSVYAFSGGAYTGYHGTTDASGQAVFTLPEGSYRFRADRNGTEFWSAGTDSCTIPSCTADLVTVTIPVAVTVASESGTPYPDLPVYVFDGDVYTGFHATSDASGQVAFTLPEGSYRFRADFNNVPFWSADTNNCMIPGCTTAAVTIPGGFGSTTTTIDYGYDALYRLTSADYSSSEFFHYTYDRVGNRLTQDTLEGTDTYTYDDASRLTSVNGVDYTWDANGNLLNDGTSTYAYDHANRLTSVVQGSDRYAFAYSGLGDRLQQTVNSSPIDYTLDINTGLTQVLSHGENAYLYGVSRIGEEQTGGWEYHLEDALGSVRQLAGGSAIVTTAYTYKPFGAPLASAGSASTKYGFAGEWMDNTGLVMLRARYLDPVRGRFTQIDAWSGDVLVPASLTKYPNAASNPISRSDPHGFCWDWSDDKGMIQRPPLEPANGPCPGSRIEGMNGEFVFSGVTGIDPIRMIVSSGWAGKCDVSNPTVEVLRASTETYWDAIEYVKKASLRIKTSGTVVATGSAPITFFVPAGEVPIPISISSSGAELASWDTDRGTYIEHVTSATVAVGFPGTGAGIRLKYSDETGFQSGIVAGIAGCSVMADCRSLNVNCQGGSFSATVKNLVQRSDVIADHGLVIESGGFLKFGSQSVFPLTGTEQLRYFLRETSTDLASLEARWPGYQVLGP